MCGVENHVNTRFYQKLHTAVHIFKYNTIKTIFDFSVLNLNSATFTDDPLEHTLFANRRHIFSVKTLEKGYANSDS